MSFWRVSLCLFICLWNLLLLAEDDILILRDNLKKSHNGDFIVTACNKNQTILLIRDHSDDRLTIEEITVAESKKIPQTYTWKDWIANGAPSHTSWILYEIDLSTGQILRSYSFTKQCWLKIDDRDNFLSKLLNLRFRLVPEENRKRIGRGPNIEKRPLWQPQMIVEGRKVDNVAFDAWRTRWPQDGSDLSGKMIEVYLPQDDVLYPGYFPYWLEISGIAGKAKIRIVDSGHGMESGARRQG